MSAEQPSGRPPPRLAAPPPPVVKSPRRGSSLRVGLTFNVKRVCPKETGEDREAEFDAPETVTAIAGALASFGHEVVGLEATAELPTALAAAGVDVVFNIAEGIRGRNREAQVPALLELLDIEYTGSDPTALSLTLDKGLAKQLVRQAGVPTPQFFLMRTGNERLPKGLTFPLIVKPVAEGSSKGVLGTSVADDEAQLRELARAIAGKYRQPALVEEYLPGREFTVALLGERRPKFLPPMEIVFDVPAGKHKVYSFEHKQAFNREVRYEAPAQVDPFLRRELERVARTSFAALGCRDVARIDVRLDARGRVNFIECNPLPGLTPDWSDLCLIAKSAQIDYRALIGEILAPAVRRFRSRAGAGRAREGG
jgi:D-alanine--D-alanine ligase